MPWANCFNIASDVVMITAASIFKGWTNPACENIIYDIRYDITYDIIYDISILNIRYDIGYNITYDISIFNIGYDIICYIRYDISILVYITCLNCSMKRNAWWWRSFPLKYIIFSSNKFYNFVNRYVLPKPHEQQKIATKKFWGALLSFVCG